MRGILLALTLGLMLWDSAQAGGGLFTVKGAEVDQHAQKVFIDWDPETGNELLVFQASFEGDTRDVGMVVPTPGTPDVEKPPPDFFDLLETYTTRAPPSQVIENPLDLKTKFKRYAEMRRLPVKTPTPVVEKPLPEGRVGHLAIKTFGPEESSELLEWLKTRKYAFAWDSDELAPYVEAKWSFTVMILDAGDLEPDGDGRLRGVTDPLLLRFTAPGLVYPLRITRSNSTRKLDVSFCVQAPDPMELPGARLEWANRLDAIDEQLLKDPASHFAGYARLKGARDVSLEVVKDVFWSSYARQVKKEMPPPESKSSMLAPLDEPYPASRGSIVQLPGTQDVNAMFWFLPLRQAPPARVAGLAKLGGILKPGRFLARFSRRYLPEETAADLEIGVTAEEKVLVRDPAP